jgi:hypothetical protein
MCVHLTRDRARTVALTGLSHAHLAATWLDKTDANVKAAPSAFTIGPIVANKSFRRRTERSSMRSALRDVLSSLRRTQQA